MNHCGGGTFRKRNETHEGHVVGKRKITADVKKAACEAVDESKGILRSIQVSLKCLALLLLEMLFTREILIERESREEGTGRGQRGIT